MKVVECTLVSSTEYAMSQTSKKGSVPDLITFSATPFQDLTRFNKIAIQGTPQMAVD